MAAYSFRAVDGQNVFQRGRIEAASSREAVERLSLRGWTVVSVDAQSSAGPREGAVKDKPASGPPRGQQAFETLITEWSRLMAIGLTIDQALAFSTSSHKGTQLGQAADEVSRGLKTGLTLEAALAAHFGALAATVRATIAAGERSGRLRDALERLALQLRSQRAFASQIRSALLYPAFVLATAIGVLTVLLVYVVPSLAEVATQNGQDLAWNAALVFSTSFFVRDNGAIILSAGIVLVGLGALMARRPQPLQLFQRVAAAIPGVGEILVARDISSFCRDVAIRVQGGHTLAQALSTAQASLALAQFRTRADELARRVAAGSRLSDAAAECLSRAKALPAFIRIGEQTGRLADLLEHAADHYEELARRRLTKISALATPVITLLTGFIVGGIVLSILSTLVGLNDAVLR